MWRSLITTNIRTYSILSMTQPHRQSIGRSTFPMVRPIAPRIYSMPPFLVRAPTSCGVAGSMIPAQTSTRHFTCSSWTLQGSRLPVRTFKLTIYKPIKRNAGPFKVSRVPSTMLLSPMRQVAVYLSFLPK